MGVTVELDECMDGACIVGLGQAGDVPLAMGYRGMVEMAAELVEAMRRPGTGLIPTEDRLRLLREAVEMERAALVLRSALAGEVERCREEAGWMSVMVSG